MRIIGAVEESCPLHHVDGQEHVRLLPVEVIASGCTSNFVGYVCKSNRTKCFLSSTVLLTLMYYILLMDDLVQSTVSTLSVELGN